MTDYSNLIADSNARITKAIHDAAIVEYEHANSLVQAAITEVENYRAEHNELVRKIGKAKANVVKAQAAREAARLRMEEAASHRFGPSAAEQQEAVEQEAAKAMASTFSPRVVNGD